MVKRYLVCFIMSLLVMASPALAAGEEGVRSMVPQDVLLDYIQFLDGRDPLAITFYGGPHSRRDVVELVLAQQALHLGGMEARVEFVPGPSYARVIEQVRVGNSDMTCTSAWLVDLEGMERFVSPSLAVVEDGRFEAGLYTASDNRTALGTRTLEEVRRLRAVSSRHWKPDWKTLQDMGMKKLMHLGSWQLMVQTVTLKRADFLLAPFQPTPGLGLHTDTTVLKPIPGIKVGLAGSRHFFVNTVSPRGGRLHEALNRGLEQMRSNGTLERAYRESGFYHPAVKDWKRLN